MARHVLIVERSSALRHVLQARILAILDDVVISEASGIEQACYVLDNNTVHLVIYGWDAPDRKGFDFCRRELGERRGGEIPCLLLVNSGKESDAGKLAEGGLTSYIRMPCTDSELGAAINRACDPLGLRRSKRYNMTGVRGVIEQRKLKVDMEVINFSSGGVLCEFEVGLQFNCADPAMISITFTEQDLRADRLHSVVSSLKVITRNSDYTPHLIRVGFKFINVPEQAAAVLNEVFARAERHCD